MKSIMQAVAHPWQCDVLGHLTTRFYVAIFDDASYFLLNRLFGWPGNGDPSGQFAFVDVRHEISYKEEVQAGDLLQVDADIEKVGKTSLTVKYELRRPDADELVASLQSTMVLLDTTTRASVTINDDMRQQIEAQR